MEFFRKIELKHSTHTLLIMLIVAIFISCDDHRISPLESLEEAMEANPDSILHVLEEMPDSALSTSYDRARYSLLLMMARDKCYLPLKSDSNLLKSTEYFRSHGDKYQEMKSRYYAGLAFRHEKRYQKALWEALNAIEVSHEVADTFWMAKAHDLAYEIYSENYDCRNAAIEADKAAIFFKRVGKETSHRYALLEKASALNTPVSTISRRPLGEGLSLLDSLIDICQSSGDIDMLCNCLLQKSGIMSHLTDYNQSNILADSLLALSTNPYYRVLILPTLIYNNIHQNKPCENLISELSTHLYNIDDTLTFIDINKQLNVTNQDWQSAFRNADSIIYYHERILGEKIFNSMDEIKVTYGNRIIKDKTQENINISNRNKRLYYCLAGLFLVSIGAILVFRHRNKKIREHLNHQLFDMMMEREKFHNLAITNKQLAEENRNLNEQLSFMEKLLEENKILTTRLTNLNDNIIKEKEMIVKKEDFLGNRIDALCSLIKEYYESDDKPEYKTAVYNQMLVQVKQLRSSRFKKKLVDKVNEFHNNILERLKTQMPNATAGDMTWLAMVIIGLEPGTICFLLDMEKPTFYSKRSRFRQYIEKSSAVDKDEFLSFFPKSRPN